MGSTRPTSSRRREDRGEGVVGAAEEVALEEIEAEGDELVALGGGLDALAEHRCAEASRSTLSLQAT